MIWLTNQILIDNIILKLLLIILDKIISSFYSFHKIGVKISIRKQRNYTNIAIF